MPEKILNTYGWLVETEYLMGWLAVQVNKNICRVLNVRA